MISLNACGTVAGSCKLISFPEYTEEFTKRFAEEFDNLPPGAVRTFVVDATHTRSELRVCRDGSRNLLRS